jgi:hypothetical protein
MQALEWPADRSGYADGLGALGDVHLHAPAALTRASRALSGWRRRQTAKTVAPWRSRPSRSLRRARSVVARRGEPVNGDLGEHSTRVGATPYTVAVVQRGRGVRRGHGQHAVLAHVQRFPAGAATFGVGVLAGPSLNPSTDAVPGIA